MALGGEACITAAAAALAGFVGTAVGYWRGWARGSSAAYQGNGHALSPLRPRGASSLSNGSENNGGMERQRTPDSVGLVTMERKGSNTGDGSKIYGLGGFCTYSRVLLCMVGLPARGKSYISSMLVRYLRWTGFPVEIFNAGSLRRQNGLASVDASFFSGEGTAQAKREHIASQCMEQAIGWLEDQDDVSVAIFDATNTTKRRRMKIADACRGLAGITPVFVESICDDPEVLKVNYAMKMANDDYKDMDPEVANADFLRRVEAYAERYETVEDDEDDGQIRYIKLFNVGQKVVLRRCDGYAPSHIGFYLSNIHVTPRRIWLARHAETLDGEKGILGSVSKKLTSTGARFSRELARYLYTEHSSTVQGDSNIEKILVLTGTAPVHQATYQAMCRASIGSSPSSLAAAQAAEKYPLMSTSLLNELDGGDCNGMSYDQIKAHFPDVWDAREKDKLNFRYPGAGGESYKDVINRIRPVIVELERHHCSILVISHLAVQRCIYAYFTGCCMEELPYLPLDMHTLYELRIEPHCTRVESIALGG